MKLYALKIRKTDIALITLLNSGVTPEIEKKNTYFVFDATWNTDVPNKIISEREFLKYNISMLSPILLSVNEL